MQLTRYAEKKILYISIIVAYIAHERLGHRRDAFRLPIIHLFNEFPPHGENMPLMQPQKIIVILKRK